MSHFVVLVIGDDVDPDTWNDRVWKLLRDLPEDTLITAVDCHI